MGVYLFQIELFKFPWGGDEDDNDDDLAFLAESCS